MANDPENAAVLTELRRGPRFDIWLVETETLVWLIFRAHLPRECGIVRDVERSLYWSRPVSEPEALSADELAEELAQRLQRCLTDYRTYSHDLQYFPKGWQFWGMGTPEPFDPYRRLLPPRHWHG
ncbi:MAG: hypothetical protein FJX77_12950 [Armatimonadetes bacterium]|nr:hypothetical protein [Armatimonadota bacterium]